MIVTERRAGIPAYRQVVTLDEAAAAMPAETGANDEPVRSTIQIARTGIWSHPWYGELVISEDTLQDFVDHFYAGVLGIDLAVDQEHDPSGGAAGWFRELHKRGNELWAEIEWTPLGAQLVRDQVYRYFSIDYLTVHINDETGVKTPNVMQGGALTNRPFIKGMAPVMLSEADAGVALWPQHDEEDGVNTITLSEELQTRLGLDSAEVTMDQLQQAIDQALGNAADDADAESADDGENVELSTDAIRLLDQRNRQLTEENRRLSERVTALEAENRQTRWLSYRDSKIREGRLTMALSEQFEGLYMSDPERATAIIDAMPVLVDLSEHGAGGAGEHDDDPAARMLTEVRKYQTDNPGVGFNDALRAVQLAQPDLARAYEAHVQSMTRR